MEALLAVSHDEMKGEEDVMSTPLKVTIPGGEKCEVGGYDHNLPAEGEDGEEDGSCTPGSAATSRLSSTRWTEDEVTARFVCYVVGKFLPAWLVYWL